MLQVLDSFKKETSQQNKPFRMPVQDVYKFTMNGDNRRIIAGTIETGKISVGDEVVFFPSGKRTTVKSLEAFNREPQIEIGAGWTCGFTVKEQIYIKRGEMACLVKEPQPKVTGRLLVNLFWLGKKPLVKGKDYFLKLGTAKVTMQLEDVRNVMDASSLDNMKKEQVDRHEVAECVLSLDRHIAFDLISEIAATSRFVIVDEYEICGGGIVMQEMEDHTSWVRDKVLLRNFKWVGSDISNELRAENIIQKPALILITGEKASPVKDIARVAERQLFDAGRYVYYLGIGGLMYGLDSDIIMNMVPLNRREHIRRLAEVAHIMLDSGMILIVSAVELDASDLDVIKTSVPAELISVVWVGKTPKTDIPVNIFLSEEDKIEDSAQVIREQLNL